MAETTYTYCFLRKDLPGVVRAIQLGHACMELGKVLDADEPIANLILFEVEDEQHLIRISDWLDGASIRHHMFYEPDYNTGYTAIACEPISDNKRILFSGFDLFRWENEDAIMEQRRSRVDA